VDGSDLRVKHQQLKALSLHEITKKTFSPSPDLHIGTEGEFTGWWTWPHDNFETHSGPFWHRIEEDGSIRCAFRVEKKHINGSGNVHGGCFMTFADYCLYAIASPLVEGRCVTTNFACEFLDAGREGDLVVGTGEVTRAGGSLIFLRGELKTGERTLFTFSGTIKRVKRKAGLPANA